MRQEHFYYITVVMHCQENNAHIFPEFPKILLTKPLQSVIIIADGALAQLGVHHTGSVGVRGSSPLCSTSTAFHSVWDAFFMKGVH